MPIRRAALGMFLAAGAALAFEVALTRICSVLLQYHLSFAVVSMAVLGVGLGGFLAWAGTRRDAGAVPGWTRSALVALPVGILVALVVLLRLPFARYWPFLLFLVLPVFVAAGAYQSLVVRQFAERAGRLYAADLAGGAVGALVAAAALGPLGGPVDFGLVLAVAAAGFAWLWTGGHGFAGRAAPVVLGLALAATFAQAMGGWLDVSYARAPGKLLSQLLRPTELGSPRLLPELQRWDAYSRIDVLELAAPRGTQRLVFIDGETPTPMLESGSGAPNAAGVEARDALAALPCRLAPPRDVLSIGSGGGYDVVVARAFGASSIDAVELNAGVLTVVEAARDFAGDVYRQPGVRLHHAEGRLFARRAPRESYDLVFLALAQSLAGNLQEYALSENYLYTREAFSDYLRILRPGGTLALLVSNPVVCQKLLGTALAVLGDRGAPAEACVAALASRREMPYAYLVLVRPTPFSDLERAALSAEVVNRGYEVAHLPPGAETPAARLASPPDADHSRMQPATDERPFFFHLEPGTPLGLRLLLGVAAAALAIAWAALVLVARRSRNTAGGDDARPRGSDSLVHGGYFVLLGLAFLMVEVLVLQRTIRVVGFPTLNLGLVLATFLVAAGCGSAASERLERRAALGGVLGILGLALLGLQPLLGLFEPWLERLALPVRCVALAAVLFPFGFLMGMPFPAGVRLLPARARTLVPWFWGLNGIASVAGSALVVAVVLEAGFRLAGILPAVLYLVALVALRRFEARTADASA